MRKGTAPFKRPEVNGDNLSKGKTFLWLAQVHWLLPDFPFESKLSLEQNQKAQTWKLRATLSLPASISLCALRVSLPTCLGTPSGVSATPGALHTPFLTWSNTPPPSSSCCCKEATAASPLQQTFPHRSQQNHTTVSTELWDTGKRLLSEKLTYLAITLSKSGKSVQC